MKTQKMTKAELTEWLKSLIPGNGVYVVINGGGISLIEDDSIECLIESINSEDYAYGIDILSKGQEYEDFVETMSSEEYADATFLRVKHYNQYNSENMDIQIAYYEF